MWKASIGVKPIPPPRPAADEDDDWETDPNFVNNISEKESRWGAKTVEGSGHQDSVCMDELRDAVLQSDAKVKESLFSQPKPSAGYGGKFGVETDRVDKSAAGYDYKGKVESHASQRDYSKGFGGIFGVQTDRQDQSAVGWADREALAKHESQKDYAVGFGGKHGVQSDRKDKSAVGWDYHEKLQQHESQKDYKQGFGGQYGVQADRKDKSAVGWDDNEKLQQHESQTDYKKGFGGQFGVQVDRKDKSAVGWNDHEKWQQHENQIVKKTVEKSTAGSAVSRHNLEKHESQKPAAAVSMECGQAMSILRNKFEQLVTAGSVACDEAKVREERERRRREDEQLRQQQAGAERQRQQKIDAEWAAVPADQTLQDQALQADEPPKSWPSIGIRLPYSTAAITKDAAPPKPARTPEHAVQDQATAVPPTPPPTTEATVAAVLPPSLSALLPPRRSSTDDEANDNNDEEWADHSSGVSSQQPTVAQQQQTLPQTQQSQLQYEEPPPVETVNQQQAELQFHQQPQQPIGGLTAVALFDYERQDDDEIGFNVDDIITDIEQIDAGWWRGTCHGRFGLFPANYVQLR